MAERAIRTFKKNFIAGLRITYPKFTIRKWDQLIKQEQLTMNLLRTYRLYPRISTEAQTNGAFDYIKTTIAPPVTKVLIFKDPNVCTLWDPHGVDAWFVGHSR